MKKFITLAAFAVATALVLQPNFIYTNSANAPVAHTGAPDEPTCATTGCHLGPATTTGNFIELATAGGGTNLNSGYTPGATYNLSLGTGSINKPRRGFSMTALDANENAAGDYTINGSNNNVLLRATSGNRIYIGHKNASTVPSWTFQWTAPATDVGTVTFYIAVNGAGDPVGNGGDMIFTTAYTVSTSQGLTRVGGGTGIEVLNADDNNISIYPNPAKDKILMQYGLENDATASIELYNLNGQVMQTFFNGKQAQGKHNQLFELNNNISKGLYLVRFNVGEKVFFKKLLVD